MTQTCALVVLGARGRCSAVALNARATTACALVVVMGVRRRRRHRAGDLGARGRWPHRPCSRGGPVVHACAGWPRRIMLLHVAAPYRARMGALGRVVVVAAWRRKVARAMSHVVLEPIRLLVRRCNSALGSGKAWRGGAKKQDESGWCWHGEWKLVKVWEKMKRKQKWTPVRVRKGDRAPPQRRTQAAHANVHAHRRRPRGTGRLGPSFPGAAPAADEEEDRRAPASRALRAVV